MILGDLTLHDGVRVLLASRLLADQIRLFAQLSVVCKIVAAFGDVLSRGRWMNHINHT